jgi:small subunit ribosomal protein S1
MTTENQGGDFAAMFEELQKTRAPGRAKNWRVGERVEATISRITHNAVFVDLDEKRQAWIDPAELLGPTGQVTVRVGEVIAAHVIEVDPKSGNVKLGRSLGRGAGAAGLELARSQGIAVEGKITVINKGGAEVELEGGIRAFCPTSQLENRFVADTSSFVGRTLKFKVTEVRDGGRSVVLSRRALLEAEAREAQERILRTLAPGAIVKGSITGIREFGAFVDLGGAEGLIPASELSHDSHIRPSDVVKPGDLIEVQVKEIRQHEGQVKITLSLKALAPDPWTALDVVAPIGRVVSGTITRTTDFGAFVRLGAGIEGLLHASELPGREAPSKVFTQGQAVLVAVKSTDAATKRISLGLAHEGAAAGASVQSYAAVPGAIVKGVVDHIETFGVFVQIENTKGRGGRGLIPNIELGLQRGADVRKHFPEGTTVTAKVLETGEGRLRLSLRAVREDEERSAYEGYQSRTTGGSNRGMGTLGDMLKNKLKK